jgi:hypothetical protein
MSKISTKTFFPINMKIQIISDNQHEFLLFPSDELFNSCYECFLLSDLGKISFIHE